MSAFHWPTPWPPNRDLMPPMPTPAPKPPEAQADMFDGGPTP